jgi:DNA-binding transcriptional ArsR family regulator
LFLKPNISDCACNEKFSKHALKDSRRQIMSTAGVINRSDHEESARVFKTAAELFGVLSTPIRLQVLNALCDGERSVSQMVDNIGCTQPNLSQHLNVLYRSGILAKRKEGTTVMYRVQSQKAMAICRSVCTQVAIELDDPAQIEQQERLVVH